MLGAASRSAKRIDAVAPSALQGSVQRLCGASSARPSFRLEGGIEEPVAFGGARCRDAGLGDRLRSRQGSALDREQQQERGREQPWCCARRTWARRGVGAPKQGGHGMEWRRSEASTSR